MGGSIVLVVMSNAELAQYPDVLFPYAYNILGSVDDAKDAVQDVISNYIVTTPAGEVHDLKNYLIKSVVNRAINIKKKNQKIVHEQVTLPEPVATETSDGDLHLNDIVSYAMMILLEQLTVKERAVFVLKEAFNYSHDEIADVLSMSIENCRKVLSRAKRKLSVSTSIGEVIKGKNKPYLDNYITAIRNRDTDALEQLFAEEVVIVADGGSTVNVVRNVTTGVSACMKLMLYVYEQYQQGWEVRFSVINHQPAILFYDGGMLHNCQVFTINAANKIEKISSILDAEKLKYIAKITE